MAKYFNTPGMFIKEKFTTQRKIISQPTNIVGFVGKGFNFRTISLSLIEILKNFDSFKDEIESKTIIENLSSQINLATTIEDINLLNSKLKILKTKIKSYEKEKIDKVFLQIEKKIEEVKKLIENLNTPILITSWDEYKEIFGLNSNIDDLSKEGFLAPSIYGFFQNGGEKCYLVSTLTLNLDELIGTLENKKGLSLLENIDEISLVSIPGITSIEVQQRIIEHCEKLKYRFAILDSSFSQTTDELIEKRELLKSEKGYAAIYYPWIEFSVEVENSEGVISFKNIMIPPSGAIAGIISQSESELDLHMAPANKVIEGTISLEKNLSTDEFELLNSNDVNCIRNFIGRGIVIWGARTIAEDIDYKFINSRRLISFFESRLQIPPS